LTQDKDGNYFLRVRRNKLKGGHTSITYKIADDYEINTYRIPDKLAKEIQQYIELTKHLDETELQTLFVLDPHYKQWGRSKSRKNRYLTYVNMNTILRYFFKTVIIDQHHFTVCYDHPNRHLNNNEICYIHLGDTRHIALINMMQEGATPVIAMMLAGHTNMVTASHYYSNVTTLLECKTYRQCRKLLHGDNTYQITASIANPHFDKLSPKTPLSDGGYCLSAEYNKGSILDCLKATGANGEIGYCPTCVFYRSSTGAFFSSDDIYKQNLSADCEALVQAVRVVRAHQGNVEDIGEALLRVRASSSSYERFLLSKKIAAKEG